MKKKKTGLTKTQFKTWLKALRSGEYEQGDGRLREGDKFCCLGVAYDVLVDGDWVWRRADVWGVPYGLPEKPGIQTGVLPDDLKLFDQKTQGFLANMNDKGKSFTKIADWLEANPQKVLRS